MTNFSSDSSQTLNIGTNINHAVDVVRRGLILAYPTESIFGLGCDPKNEAALNALLTLKRRDPGKGLILITGNTSQLREYIQMPLGKNLRRIRMSWPQNVTWVYPARVEMVSPLLTGGRDSIAARLTTHPVVCELCQKLGHPIVSTSANQTGEAPVKSGAQIRNAFSNVGPSYVLDLPVGDASQPSKIIEAWSGKILRS